MKGLLPFLGLLAFAMMGCFESSTGGSETTNGLSGILRDGEGKPAARAAVTLVPETYNPVPGKDETVLRHTVTDGAGRYAFNRVAPGVYNVEGLDMARNLMVLVRGLHVTASQSAPVEADGVLEPPGSLDMPFADRKLPPGAVAYLPGTTYFASAATGGGPTLTLAALPPGGIPEVKVGFIDSAADLSFTLVEDVTVKPGAATAMTPVEAWRHSRSLTIDGRVLSSGESLKSYPLLLRLHSGNFDFSQAGPSGEDIRFARADGSRLPYQIEHWDAPGRTAVVWIRLDSLPHVLDASIAMHWGREDAVDQSLGTAVFDSALGFSTVWHLAEAGNAEAGGYKDAAAFSHATAAAPDAASRTEAPAGFGKRFGDGGGALTAPMPRAFGGNHGFSVSFWMKFEAEAKRQNILRFGGDSLLMGFHFLIRPDTTAQFGPFDRTPDATPSGWQNHFPLADHVGKWIQVTTVYDAERSKLISYVNGIEAAVNDLPLLEIQAAPGVKVGSPIADEASFHGVLDEVRFYDRPLGEAWIRAEYATQKEGSAILEMK